MLRDFNNRLKTISLIVLTALTHTVCAQQSIEVHVCIYGGTSAGVIAAYPVQKLGKKAILIEHGSVLGGMSSGGLGYTDIGNKYAITGLSRDFYRRVGKHYGKFEQWIFEPNVAERIFNDYMHRRRVDVRYRTRLKDVRKDGNSIIQIVLENSDTQQISAVVKAKIFIDCSYEGDLMAKAGVSYVVGREDNSDYAETINGVQLMGGHQFPDGIDPYKVPGKPEIGLLWGVSNEALVPNGTGDKKVQAYNYRICLQTKPLY
ncbi:MAG TPA: FAD-dependent oxidoreductase [Cyclobacteriaceae bacterium]|nr:FAD-dependent oxidoreductase [Cyclobacteriaceae bacterium]